MGSLFTFQMVMTDGSENWEIDITLPSEAGNYNIYARAFDGQDYSTEDSYDKSKESGNAELWGSVALGLIGIIALVCVAYIAKMT